MGNDNFGFKIGIEGEREFKNSLRDINQSFKVLGSEMNLVTSQFDRQDKSLQAMTARNNVLNKEIDAQKNKVSTLEAALKNAADSFGEADRRTQNWAIQLNNAKADLNKMEKELDQNVQALNELDQGFDEAEEGAEQFADAVNDAAEKTEDASGKFEKVGGVLKGIGAAIGAAVVAIGSAAIATGASLIKLGDEYNMAINQISASTGATGQELEELGEVAQNVYKHNFGSNLEDVANGIAEVKKVTGLMGQELEKATESGFALHDTFGFELQESALALKVKQLAKLDDQYFEIVQISKSIQGSLPICSVICEHVSYTLNHERYNITAFDFTGSPSTGLGQLLAGTPFTVGTVDFTTSVTMKINQKVSRRAALM